MTRHWITTDVEVDLGDFDDDDIAEEYETRGLGGESSVRDLIEEMFYAFKLGKQDRAVELAREIAQNATGKILP
jgi:hypothetical protein